MVCALLTLSTLVRFQYLVEMTHKYKRRAVSSTDFMKSFFPLQHVELVSNSKIGCQSWRLFNIPYWRVFSGQGGRRFARPHTNCGGKIGLTRLTSRR